jgi:type IV secretion system protein VirB8
MQQDAYQSSQNIDEALLKNKHSEQTPPTKKLKINEAVTNYLKQTKQFETDTIAIAKSSEKIAWKVTAGLGVITALSIITLIVMLPLKESVPYLVRVDNATGETKMVQPLSDAQETSYGEVLDKHWLNQFIISRNGYMWETVQNSYNTVLMMSNDNVFKEYEGYIFATNAPPAVFGEDLRIRLDVRDIIFLPRAADSEHVIAQINFSRITENSDGSPATKYAVTHWTSTLTFDYQGSINSEEEQLINPLGFRVTSYREDRSQIE